MSQAAASVTTRSPRLWREAISVWHVTRNAWRRAPTRARPGRARTAGLGALAFMLFVLPAGSASAEEGLVNAHLELGAAVLATDAAVDGVDRAGLDFTIKVDLPVHRWIAPQLGYGLIYLPGRGDQEVGVNLIMFGARVRVLNDEGGFLANLWPAGPKGNAWGNLWVDLGLGYAHAPTADAGSDWFALQVGLGYEFSLASPLQVGPYLAYRHVFKTGTDASFIAIGVSVSFGYPKKLPETKPARRRPAPRTNLRGRPGDRDGDQVSDETDQCPSTPPEAKVDDKGCEYIRGRLIFDKLRFLGDSAELAPGALFQIRRMAEIIRAHPEVRVEIGGHTDSPGSAEDNLRLSLERAKVVRDELVRMGVSSKQLTVRGYGVSTPIKITGTAEEKRKKNVRIEFRFTIDQPKPE